MQQLSLLETMIVEKTEYSKEFIEFWLMYPRKAGKPAAYRSWNRAKPDIEKVRTHITKQSRSEQWQNKKFIPMPSTYLNQRRWEDEPDQEVNANAINARQSVQDHTRRRREERNSINAEYREDPTLSQGISFLRAKTQTSRTHDRSVQQDRGN